MGKKKEECPAGAPMWMTTFSDLVTLLLTFFVLLLTMATMDPVKFVLVKTSIRESFGWKKVTSTVKYTLPILPSPPKSEFKPIPQETKVQYFKRIEMELKKAKLIDQVELIKRPDDAIVLRINDSVLFDKGQTRLNPSAYPLLRKISNLLRPLPLSMRIEGHTDSTPVRSTATTNWDISVERAVAVLRFYNRGKLFPLDRMAAVGYGVTKPIVPNTSEEGRQKNRRVDFILRGTQQKIRPLGQGRVMPF